VLKSNEQRAAELAADESMRERPVREADSAARGNR